MRRFFSLFFRDVKNTKEENVLCAETCSEISIKDISETEYDDCVVFNKNHTDTDFSIDHSQIKCNYLNRNNDGIIPILHFYDLENFFNFFDLNNETENKKKDDLYINNGLFLLFCNMFISCGNNTFYNYSEHDKKSLIDIAHFCVQYINSAILTRHENNKYSCIFMESLKLVDEEFLKKTNIKIDNENSIILDYQYSDGFNFSDDIQNQLKATFSYVYTSKILNSIKIPFLKNIFNLHIFNTFMLGDIYRFEPFNDFLLKEVVEKEKKWFFVDSKEKHGCIFASIIDVINNVDCINYFPTIHEITNCLNDNKKITIEQFNNNKGFNALLSVTDKLLLKIYEEIKSSKQRFLSTQLSDFASKFVTITQNISTENKICFHAFSILEFIVCNSDKSIDSLELKVYDENMSCNCKTDKLSILFCKRLSHNCSSYSNCDTEKKCFGMFILSIISIVVKLNSIFLVFLKNNSENQNNTTLDNCSILPLNQRINQSSH